MLDENDLYKIVKETSNIEEYDYKRGTHIGFGSDRYTNSTDKAIAEISKRILRSMREHKSMQVSREKGVHLGSQ